MNMNYNIYGVTIPELDTKLQVMQTELDMLKANDSDLRQRLIDLAELVNHLDDKVVITTTDLENLEKKYNEQPFEPSGLNKDIDRKAELAEWDMEELRMLAVKYGYPVDDVNAADKTVLVETIYEDEQQQYAAAQIALEGSERHVQPLSGEGGTDTSPLEGMSLRGLREVANDRRLDPDKFMHLSQDELLAVLSGPKDSADEDDESFERADLEAKTVVALKAIAKAVGVTVPANTSKATLVDLILAAE